MITHLNNEEKQAHAQEDSKVSHCPSGLVLS